MSLILFDLIFFVSSAVVMAAPLWLPFVLHDYWPTPWAYLVGGIIGTVILILFLEECQPKTGEDAVGVGGTW